MRCDDEGATAIAVMTSDLVRPLVQVIIWPLVKSPLIARQLAGVAPPVVER
jgi:hypothetical protein